MLLYSTLLSGRRKILLTEWINGFSLIPLPWTIPESRSRNILPIFPERIIWMKRIFSLSPVWFLFPSAPVFVIPMMMTMPMICVVSLICNFFLQNIVLLAKWKEHFYILRKSSVFPASVFVTSQSTVMMTPRRRILQIFTNPSPLYKSFPYRLIRILSRESVYSAIFRIWNT